MNEKLTTEERAYLDSLAGVDPTIAKTLRMIDARSDRADTDVVDRVMRDQAERKRVAEQQRNLARSG